MGLIRYDTGVLVPQVDVIGHSMGGLIIRSYLAGLMPDGSLSPPLDPRVRKFIEIATPNFGSFLAVSGFGIQTAEMIPGSSFLWSLATWNQRGDDLRGVDALAVVGNGGYKPLSNFPPAKASDGVVSISSASLGFARDPTRTRILPYCHADFGQFEQIVVDCQGSGIAKAAETEQIVRSFLSNTSAWQAVGTTPPQDPWLSKYGGMFFGDVTATNQWVSDVTGVSFGTVPLIFGGATGVIASGTLFYQDLVSGTDTFHISSRSLGLKNCGPVTEPVGYFTAWRCKSSPVVSSVGPLLSVSGRIVQSGGTVTISGVGFGPRCSSCAVLAYPGPVSLAISSWSDQSISAALPSTFNGIAEIMVQAAAGSDAITFMAAPPPAPPTISLSSVQLQFSYTTGGQTPAAQTVGVSNSGGSTLTWTASANATWINLAAAPNGLTVSVNPAELAAGTYKGAISLIAPGATNSPQTVSVTLTVTAAPAVSVVVTSVTNSASGAPGAIAPGEIITIKGTGLGPAMGVSFSVDPTTNTVASTLGGTRVLFGLYAAPITYSSATQINAIVPYEVVGQSLVMQVQYQGASSAGTNVQVASAAPGIFTFNATGSGPAVAVNQDGTVNDPSHPAAKGSYVTIYFTGGGQTNPPGVTGSVTGAVLKWLTQAISVTVGEQPTTVTFDGAAPTFVDGVGQLNIQLAPDVPSGSALPVVIKVGGASCPATATLAVQ